MLEEVYPRACGGTDCVPYFLSLAFGLSPRLRGNPLRRLPFRRRLRSIPAPAGEPSAPVTLRAEFGVYPRACGGTQYAVVDPEPDAGLSPRLRGNRIADRLRPKWVGSIPAPAGEPGEGA